MSSITHITSVSQLNDILSKSGNKVSVIDFHATWCGPCHAISPKFSSLADLYNREMNFLKCDVDAAQDVASLYRVSAMPTFIFLRGKQKIDQIRGANERELEKCVRKYASSSGTAAFSGRGQTLGGDPAPIDAARDFQDAAGNVAAGFSKLDPQTRVLVGLFIAYLVFWYLS